MKGNWTAGTANEADNAMPSCADTGGSHLNYVSGTGITCGTTTGGNSALTRASKTTGYTVTSADDGTYFDNIGAGGTVIFTLPTSPSTAQRNCYFAGAAQIVEILAPASTKINVGTTASATAGNMQSTAAIGNTVCLYALSSTQWVAAGTPSGTWTIN
jgi:hypothetical protein